LGHWRFAGQALDKCMSALAGLLIPTSLYAAASLSSRLSPIQVTCLPLAAPTRRPRCDRCLPPFPPRPSISPCPPRRTLCITPFAPPAPPAVPLGLHARLQQRRRPRLSPRRSRLAPTSLHPRPPAPAPPARPQRPARGPPARARPAARTHRPARGPPASARPGCTGTYLYVPEQTGSYRKDPLYSSTY
jgi:hypothetical protein